MTEQTTILISALGIVLAVIVVHIKSRKERTDFEMRIMSQHHTTQLQVQKVRLAVHMIADSLGIKLPNGEERR